MCYHIFIIQYCQSVSKGLSNRLFSRLGSLTNAKQNDKLEETETAKIQIQKITSTQIKLKHAHFAH